MIAETETHDRRSRTGWPLSPAINNIEHVLTVGKQGENIAIDEVVCFAFHINDKATRVALAFSFFCT